MTDDKYEATIADRAKVFEAALNDASRVTVHTPSAPGEWDIQTFAPAVVKHAIRREQ